MLISLDGMIGIIGTVTSRSGVSLMNISLAGALIINNIGYWYGDAKPSADIAYALASCVPRSNKLDDSF